MKKVLKLFYLTLLFAVLFALPASAAMNIPSDAGTYKGHRYYVFPSKTCSSYEAAEEYCKSLGGHLAVINSAGENRFLYNYIIKNEYSNPYFGYKKTAAGWDWTEDYSSKYTNWHVGEPEGQPYARFKSNANGTWCDDYWGNWGNSSFVCEWDIAKPKKPIITNVKKKSGVISGKTTKKVTVYVKVGTKTYSKASNKKGIFKIKTRKIKSGTKIKIWSINKYGVKSSTRTLSVW